MGRNMNRCVDKLSGHQAVLGTALCHHIKQTRADVLAA